MGWGWSQVGRENVPGGVQLLKDPPVDEQVLLSLREKERERPSAAWGLQRNHQERNTKPEPFPQLVHSTDVGVTLPSIQPHPKETRGL